MTQAIHDARPTMRPVRRIVWGCAALLLLLPLIAMRFTHEVNWSAGDFVAAALLLGGGALFYDLAERHWTRPSQRLLIGGAILFVVMLVWAEGAVGLFH